MKDVTDIFKKRFKELRIQTHKTQEELANDLGISRGAVSYYENGDRVPDIKTLYCIADYFDVTSDYLIGLSDNSTQDLSIQDICQKTGLSDKTINNIVKLNTKTLICGSNSSILKGLDYILSHFVDIDIFEGKLNDYDWDDAHCKEGYKGGIMGGAPDDPEIYREIFYYGDGIDFFKKLNSILFDTYADFNPYTPIGHGNDTVQVIDKENAFRPQGTFTLINNTGESCIFDFEIITKALLLELNNVLEKIRNEIKPVNNIEFNIEFDEKSNELHKMHKKYYGEPF